MSNQNTQIPYSGLLSSAFDLNETNEMSTLMTYLTQWNANPFEYRYRGSAGIGYKKVIYMDTNDTLYTNQTFYGNRYDFLIPKCSGYLAQILIEFTLLSAGDNSNCQPRLGTRLCKDVFLETQRGPDTIQWIRPDYTNSILDELSVDNEQIELSTEPSVVPWTAGTQIVCYLPCFFNFSDSTSKYIDTYNTEQLQITIITGNSANECGLQSDPSNWRIRTKLVFFQPSRPPTMYNFVPKIVLSSDVYYEPPQTLLMGSESITIPLTCEFVVFRMFIIIKDTYQNYVRADSFIFYNDGVIITSCDRNANYSLLSGSTETNRVGSLSYWFSITKSRESDNICLNTRDLYNKTLTVNYDTVPTGNYSLYVGFEYFYQLYINTNGNISRNLQF